MRGKKVIFTRMKIIRTGWLAVLALFASTSITSVRAAGDPNAPVPSNTIYKDPSQPVDARVADLLSRMTLDEKVQQMGEFPEESLPADDVGLAKKFGSVSPGVLVVNFSASAEANAEMFRAAQQYLRQKTRLGIPAITCCEALHGLMLQPATIYPQAIALGSTWDTPLVKEMGTQIAQEASAVGLCQVLSPVLDLGREPRYGRIEETYGECPTLVSRMGVAFITGMQGDDARQGLAADKVYCMTKHFAGYSVPANGINISPSLIGEREMLTLHLLPFEAAITEAHVMAVMPSYNSVDSVPSHASHWLLSEMLRKRWGFRGYVYSDWDGIDFLTGHRVATSRAEAGRKALSAGVDIEAPSLDCYKTLPSEVEKKQVDVAEIDQAVSRILRAKFLAGLFDAKRSTGDSVTNAKVLHQPEHIATSRKLADEGIILLKNEKNLLPLDAGSLKSIAVIGPNADQVQFGDYSWSKSNKHGINFLQAMKSKYDGKLAINYAKGCDLIGLSTDGFADAVKAANASDVSVVVIGDTSMIFSGVGWEDPTLPANGTVGEGFDVTNPVPPGVQEDLVKAIVATGKPTIVVLLNGRPYCLPWMHEYVPAIVEAFYPGERQGDSLVDILFGKVNPSGRLPVTLARSVGELPCTYDFKGFGRGYYHQPGSSQKPGRDYVFDSPAPLWPFGFGLSYTTFAYSDLHLQRRLIAAEGWYFEVRFRGEKHGKSCGQSGAANILAATARRHRAAGKAAAPI